MNNHQNTLARINEIIAKSTNGAIVLPQNPTQDAIASATSLYLALTKMGKNVSLACDQPVKSDLVASEKIQPNLVCGGDNLVISFPYSDGSIDKVDYNIQGENFNLIITPRPGYPKLNPEQVKYSYTGGVVDFIIVIDSPTLNNLGALYKDNPSQFQGKEIINIDRHLTNAFFGTVNLVNKTASSVSEIVLSVIQNLRVEIDKDIATNLYAGIVSATNNFTSYSVNADTLENAATLLRFGAAKKLIKRQNTDMPVNSFSPPPPISYQSANTFKPFPSTNQRVTPEIQSVKPIESVEKESQSDQSANPQEWLKPKIFKGSGLI